MNYTKALIALRAAGETGTNLLLTQTGVKPAAEESGAGLVTVIALRNYTAFTSTWSSVEKFNCCTVVYWTVWREEVSSLAKKVWSEEEIQHLFIFVQNQYSLASDNILPAYLNKPYEN